MRQGSRSRWVVPLAVVALGASASLALLEARSAPTHETQVASPTWATHLERVDGALATGSMRRAVRAWHDAYAAALGSRSWEAMVAVGDAALRLGDARRSRDAAPTARQAYLIALFRARDQRSMGGLLRTAEAFASLNDEEVAVHALRLADRLDSE